MTILIREVYDAFKEAGVSEETARKASEALTGYEDRFHHLERKMDNRFNEIQQQMDRCFGETDLKIEGIKGMQRLLQWMVGFVIAITTSMFFLMLRAGAYAMQPVGS